MEALEPFVLRALAAGLGVAVVAGVIGCFVVWQRMAYFGDSLAHSSLLGIALGFAAGVGVNVGILAICLAFAFLLVCLQRRRILTTDTLLGILAHSALSMGMVAISALELRLNLHSYLFGDMLMASAADLYWIFIGGGAVLALLAFNWSSLILMTVSEDLARAEGHGSFGRQLLLMLLMTVVVAIGVRIVGILLITSMLIIPAATARQLARSPEMMAALSAVIAAMATVLGLAASLRWDVPTAPAIVVAATANFLLFSLLGSLAGRKP